MQSDNPTAVNVELVPATAPEQAIVAVQPQQTALANTIQQEMAPALRFTPEQIEVLKRMYFKGCSDDEIAVSMAIVHRTQLDPFTRQIFFIKRRDNKLDRDVLSPQVSIDGFRLIAERTGRYAGQLGPWWCGEDGVWSDVWLDTTKPPVAAKVGVLKHGFTEPLYAVARFKSYAGTTHFWRTMPDVMIAKVAEALALRKAFPLELSGIYSSDEMDQADVPMSTTHQARPGRQQQSKPAEPPVQSKHLVELVGKTAQEAGVMGDNLKMFIASRFPEKKVFKALDDKDLSRLVALLKQRIRENEQHDVDPQTPTTKDGEPPSTDDQVTEEGEGIEAAEDLPPIDYSQIPGTASQPSADEIP